MEYLLVPRAARAPMTPFPPASSSQRSLSSTRHTHTRISRAFSVQRNFVQLSVGSRVHASHHVNATRTPVHPPSARASSIPRASLESNFKGAGHPKIRGSPSWRTQLDKVSGKCFTTHGGWKKYHTRYIQRGDTLTDLGPTPLVSGKGHFRVHESPKCALRRSPQACGYLTTRDGRLSRCPPAVTALGPKWRSWALESRPSTLPISSPTVSTTSPRFFQPLYATDTPPVRWSSMRPDGWWSVSGLVSPLRRRSVAGLAQVLPWLS